ncbi:MAG: hypothetical protein AB7N76_07965 [Planctomycetota bacterium]
MTTRAVLASTLCLALGLCLPGCAIGNQKTGRVIDPHLIPKVKVGTSTKQDVLDLFGPPTSYSRVGAAPIGSTLPGLLGRDAVQRPSGVVGGGKEAEDVFVYEYVEDDESFFTMLLFTWFRRETLADRLMVFFDAKDVVKYLAYARQTEAEPEAAGKE